jgi:hypothetical protein
MPVKDRREYYREYHRKNREKRNEQSMIRYFANSERAAVRNRAWRDENPEKERIRQRRYYADHTERLRAANRARYHRRRGQVDSRRGDPVEVAKRLFAKATQAARYGYSGKLVPGGF